MMGMGEKPRNIQKRMRKPRKKFPVWLLSYPPPVYEMEADYFPVSENTSDLPLVEEES